MLDTPDLHHMLNPTDSGSLRNCFDPSPVTHRHGTRHRSPWPSFYELQTCQFCTSEAGNKRLYALVFFFLGRATYVLCAPPEGSVLHTGFMPEGLPAGSGTGNLVS
ncbi:hypothetical protein G7K_5894-t1 [Saitoella complicata NRRL Y-17804]|uniref:Uncharacterized protein n=1 Tax=Saitoella complicata (strain BCRC 22490 / CBS 7301 / JCM 7358 / NBRC 10748 / NRRL Y-17804) TaxID=698492 RepID=A0A0E9NPR6_SAICN|nr:hypothetical protein G7K_5894-t1 [Saitoella complicata NRRL Y-17804]